MNWTLQRLDRLGLVARGRSRHRPRDAAHLYGGAYPFIQTGDVKRANLYITQHRQTYSDAGLQQSKLWPAGTLCITIAANIADTAILRFDSCFPDSVIGFVADDSKADARFIKYLFDATIQKQIRRFTQGAAQDNLSQEKLLSMDLLVPDIKTQIAVANILSTYDNLVENNRRRMVLLEAAVHQIYREWFIRLRFPGHEHASMIDGLPEGWKRGTVHEAADVLSGGTPSTKVADYWNGNIPFYTPKDTTDTCYVLETERAITETGLKNCNSQLFPTDTIFISARGTVGKLNLGLLPMATSQSCYALIGRGPRSQHYLFCALKDAAQHFEQNAVGAVFDAIVVDTFKLIPLVIPSARMLRLFEEYVAPFFQQLGNLVSQNQKLRAARDLLLPRLMSGEIAV